MDLTSVGLLWVQYVRVWQPAADGWSTEIDAFADVSPVPEPSSLVLAALAAISLCTAVQRKRLR